LPFSNHLFTESLQTFSFEIGKELKILSSSEESATIIENPVPNSA